MWRRLPWLKGLPSMPEPDGCDPGLSRLGSRTVPAAGRNRSRFRVRSVPLRSFQSADGSVEFFEVVVDDVDLAINSVNLAVDPAGAARGRRAPRMVGTVASAGSRAGRSTRTLVGSYEKPAARWTNGEPALDLAKAGTPAAPRGMNREPGRRFRAAAW